MMKKILIFAAAGMTALCPTAFAQDIKPSENITVTAPLLVIPKEQKLKGMHVLSLSVEKVVSYADLDLSKPGDAAKFRTRISDTAAELCKELDSKYPPAVYIPVTNQNCIKATTDSAMPVVNEIIAAK
ncbi:MAG TPA: UrcA family protein [Rhizomicrobium sp.]|nr:UrcA family protein [Rhizomicrobium sp.]